MTKRTLAMLLILLVGAAPLLAKGLKNEVEVNRLIKILKIANKSKTAWEKIPVMAVQAECAKIVPHLVNTALKDVSSEDPRVFLACWNALEAYDSLDVEGALLDHLAKTKDHREAVFSLSLLTGPVSAKIIDPQTARRADATDEQRTAVFSRRLDVVRPYLKSPWWPARLAAIKALAHLDSAETGHALVRIVTSDPRKEKSRLREAARASLRTTWSGAPKEGVHPDNWGAWWIELCSARGWEVPDDLQGFQPNLELYTKRHETISYFGQKVLSDAFILVTDYSNSMGPQASLQAQVKQLRKSYQIGEPGERPLEKITLDVQSKHECVVRKQIELLALMPETIRCNLVYFNGSVTSFKPIKELVTLDTKTKNKAIDFLTKTIGLSHGTRLYEGLEMALTNEQADEIFVLSDGRPFNSKVLDTDVIERACLRWTIMRQIRFNCVDLGPILGGIKWNNPAKKAGKSKPAEFLERMATTSGGTYTLYESLKDVSFYVPADSTGS